MAKKENEGVGERSQKSIAKEVDEKENNNKTEIWSDEGINLFVDFSVFGEVDEKENNNKTEIWSDEGINLFVDFSVFGDLDPNNKCLYESIPKFVEGSIVDGCDKLLRSVKEEYKVVKSLREECEEDQSEESEEDQSLNFVSNTRTDECQEFSRRSVKNLGIENCHILNPSYPIRMLEFRHMKSKKSSCMKCFKRITPGTLCVRMVFKRKTSWAHVPCIEITGKVIGGMDNLPEEDRRVIEKLMLDNPINALINVNHFSVSHTNRFDGRKYTDEEEKWFDKEDEMFCLDLFKSMLKKFGNILGIEDQTTRTIGNQEASSKLIGSPEEDSLVDSELKNISEEGRDISAAGRRNKKGCKLGQSSSPLGSQARNSENIIIEHQNILESKNPLVGKQDLVYAQTNIKAASNTGTSGLACELNKVRDPRDEACIDDLEVDWDTFDSEWLREEQEELLGLPPEERNLAVRKKVLEFHGFSVLT